ncbi:hypothetical protein KXQ82_13360 [Mucilaginibacter sp. HMF5004]|uniref:WD40/YVTN/BNR-like repeat-containing protein n=1 Tax=Mucilaginibacter rivuli TaxID=2857527 RepID=UPI001C5D1F82|nr:hypothetical protein [Mucilaginibacter rivuli]MBW4890714.1 hypothetical protein [Mucilaginibacter rivuli]
MKKKTTLFSLYIGFSALLCLTSCHKCNDNNSPTPSIPATYSKILSLPINEKFIVLETLDNTIYAAAASGIVYSSTNLGATWSSSAIVKQGTVITALTLFNNRIYVGTETDGIFVSDNNGTSWVNQSLNQYISSFVVWNNNLYASSLDGISPGTVFVLNQSLNTWTTFSTNGLPTNHDFDVYKIVVANNTLAAIRGVNGFFFSYNTTTGNWNTTAYLPGTPQIKMQDLISDQGTLLASAGKTLFNSTNFGTTWSYDTIGLKKLSNANFTLRARVLYAASNKFYVLSNLPTGGAWIQQRDWASPSGTTWAANDEFLQLTGKAYAMRKISNVFFIATDDGLYYKKV